MKSLALALIVAPAAALAHGMPAPHHHPHGVETVWIALAAFLAGGVIAWAIARRK